MNNSCFIPPNLIRYEQKVDKDGHTPSFYTNKDSASMQETAKSWADKEKGEELINNPFSNVKIVGLEQRNEGGRAYKVLIDDLYYVDLREDVLMDVIFAEGIQGGGELNGKFLWAQKGSQMRLILKDSEEYYEALDYGNKRNQVKIKNDDLEVGGVYESLRGDKHIYLGRANTQEIKEYKLSYNRLDIELKETKNYLIFHNISQYLAV